MSRPGPDRQAARPEREPRRRGVVHEVVMRTMKLDSNGDWRVLREIVTHPNKEKR